MKDVTICAADCVTTILAARAIANSVQLCGFGDAILFSDDPPSSSHFRSIKIEKLNSRVHYSHFILKRMPAYISTQFVLIVQWDGYVLEPAAWNANFLRYDLIGARWDMPDDEMTVGNGGFSLRSKKLIDTMSGSDFPFIPDVNEDFQICRLYRARLVNEFGMVFAPAHVADRFAYERVQSNEPTFGFHGAFNLWRHVEDIEMLTLATKVSPNVIRSVEFFELAYKYYLLRRFVPLQAIYRRIREIFSVDQVREVFTRLSDANVATELVLTCEQQFGVCAPEYCCIAK